MRQFCFAVLMAGSLVSSECLLADEVSEVAVPARDSVSTTALRFHKVASAGMEDATSAQVYLVSGGQTRVRRALGQSGTAQIGRIAPGVYSVVANGKDGWAAFGAYLGEGGINATTVGLIPSIDMPVVWQIYADARENAQLNPSPAIGVTLTPGPNIASQDPVLEIRENGTVKGVLAAASPEGQPSVSLPGMTVTLIRNGRALPSVTSDEHGNFELNSVSEGVYSLVVSGPQGFCGMSIRAERANTFVAVLAAPEMRVSPVPFTDLSSNPPPPQSPAEIEASPSTNLGSGGSGAGVAGGGGVGGGGGLLGILAGVAAGIGGAAILDDNNDKPASPAAP